MRIDPAACKEEFPFGKDGKPFFVAGPYDTPERCRRILNALVQACGVDGFHYLLPLAGPRYLPESLRDQHPQPTGPDETATLQDLDVDLDDEPVWGDD